MMAVRPLTSRSSFLFSSRLLGDDSRESTAEREAVGEESERRWFERGRRAGCVKLREFGGENVRNEEDSDEGGV